jgi:branched-chain amino acid aminotransferase
MHFLEVGMEEVTGDVEKKTTGRDFTDVSAPFRADLLIWMDGELVPWQEATVHVMAHVLHYGSSVFEGVRCYKTPQGPAILRLEEHVRRLYDSSRIYHMRPELEPAEFAKAMKETVRANCFEACYLRPIVFRGLGTPGVNPTGSPVCSAIVSWDWGQYLGDHSVESGVDACVSSWARMAPNTFPAMAKAAAHYMNAQLMKLEAVRNGYTEGIALDTRGYISEGSGENIFLVRDGIVYTPPVGASILPGITRSTVITLLREEGVQVVEEDLPREALYVADEVFFTGTATEIAPVRSVDRVAIADGEVGPITRRIQKTYLGIAHGEIEDRYGWLTPV